MFKRKRDRSYFFHLFSQISVLLVVIILIASFLLYDRISGATFKTINNMNDKIVSLISYNFDYMDNFMSTFVLNLSQDSGINYLLNAAPTDFDNKIGLLNTFKEVNDIYTSTPFVDSIYLYNARVEKFAIIGKNNGIRTKISFEDQDIIRYIYDEKAGQPLSPIPRIIPASISKPSQQSKVYSYLYVDRGSVDYPNAIIVNVDADWLIQNMNGMRDRQGRPDEFLMIVNQDGIVYGDGDNKFFLNDLSELIYVQEVIQSTEREGHFQLEVEGKPFILTYSKLDHLLLSFISGIPVEKVVAFKGDLRNFTIILAALILLIGIVASYYVSKSVVSPLKLLEKKVRGLFSSGQTPKQVKNEIRFMSTTLSDISEQMNQLQSFKSNSIAVLKNEFLHKWLTDPSVSEQEPMASHFQFYSIALEDQETYRLLLFRIDHFVDYLGSGPSGAWDQTRADMIETVMENVLQSGHGEVVDMKKDHFIIILSSAPTESTQKLEEQLNSILELIRTKFDYTLSVFISRQVDMLEEMSSVYFESLERSEYRMFKGHSSIMTENEIIEQPSRMNYEIPDADLKALQKSLFVNYDLDETMKQHDRIFTLMRQFTPSDVRLGASYLLIMLLEKVKVIEQSRSMSFDYDFVQMNNRLVSCETFDEINSFFSELYDHVSGKLKCQQDGKSEDLVIKLKEYIQSQYKDTNLSVTSLSSLLKLSPDYLRKTFKQSTGDSIQNYINDVRLEKAAEQLLSTNKVIEDIIRSVSIENTKYFYTLFKAKYGVTPAEYRLNQRKQHLISTP